MRIIVTKIDTYDPDVIGEDVKKTYHSARLQTLAEASLCDHTLPQILTHCGPTPPSIIFTSMLHMQTLLLPLY